MKRVCEMLKSVETLEIFVISVCFLKDEETAFFQQKKNRWLMTKERTY